MNKDRFNELSIKYSSVIEEIIKSNILYAGINRTIRWCFFEGSGPEITATVDRKTNLLSVNIVFIDIEYNENRLYVIEYFLLHEMRHIYQNLQIELFKNNEHTIDPKFIELWIKEGQNYIKSLDENGKENIEYFKQDCELDAYAFSYAVMHHKYHGLYDSKLYMQEIYKNELKDNFDSAVKDFLENL